MCGFKRKQATFLVGRCAHSLTHSHLTHSLLWTLIIHSLFTHSLTEMRACMSPACAGIGMESMVARMRHGCVSPCGPRPTWRPRAACVAVRNRVWRPPAPPTAHARAAHSEPRAPRPTGRAGGGAPGPPPLLCLVASCDSTTKTRLAFHFLFHFFSKTLITRLPSPSPQSISNKKSLSGWRGRRQTTQSQAAERLSVAVRISARRSCCRGGR